MKRNGTIVNFNRSPSPVQNMNLGAVGRIRACASTFHWWNTGVMSLGKPGPGLLSDAMSGLNAASVAPGTMRAKCLR